MDTELQEIRELARWIIERVDKILGQQVPVPLPIRRNRTRHGCKRRLGTISHSRNRSSRYPGITFDRRAGAYRYFIPVSGSAPHPRNYRGPGIATEEAAVFERNKVLKELGMERFCVEWQGPTIFKDPENCKEIINWLE